MDGKRVKQAVLLVTVLTAVMVSSCENISLLLQEVQVDVVRTRDGSLDANFIVQVNHDGEWVNLGVGSPSQEFRFVDTSGGKPTSWYWEFSDGSTSTARNPIKTFIPGSYDVTLTVGRLDGFSEVTDVAAAVVSDMPIATVDWEGEPAVVFDGTDPYFRDLDGLEFTVVCDTGIEAVYLTEATPPASAVGYIPPATWTEGLLWYETAISVEADSLYDFEIDIDATIPEHPGNGVYCDGVDGTRNLTLVIKESETGMVSWATIDAYQDRTAPTGLPHTIVGKAWPDNHIVSGGSRVSSTSKAHTINGSGYSDSSVTLSGLGCSDASSGVKTSYSMQFQNDSGSWGGWVPVSDSRSHSINTAPGTRSVNVRYSDAVGNVSSSVSDSIAVYRNLMVTVYSLTISDDGDSSGPGEISWWIYCGTESGVSSVMVCERKNNNTLSVYSGTTFNAGYASNELGTLSYNGQYAVFVAVPPDRNYVTITPRLLDDDGGLAPQQSTPITHEHYYSTLNATPVPYSIPGSPGGMLQIFTQMF